MTFETYAMHISWLE